MLYAAICTLPIYHSFHLYCIYILLLFVCFNDIIPSDLKRAAFYKIQVILGDLLLILTSLKEAEIVFWDIKYLHMR